MWSLLAAHSRELYAAEQNETAIYGTARVGRRLPAVTALSPDSCPSPAVATRGLHQVTRTAPGKGANPLPKLPSSRLP